MRIFFLFIITLYALNCAKLKIRQVGSTVPSNGEAVSNTTFVPNDLVSMNNSRIEPMGSGYNFLFPDSWNYNWVLEYSNPMYPWLIENKRYDLTTSQMNMSFVDLLAIKFPDLNSTWVQQPENFTIFGYPAGNAIWQIQVNGVNFNQYFGLIVIGPFGFSFECLYPATLAESYQPVLDTMMATIELNNDFLLNNSPDIIPAYNSL